MKLLAQSQALEAQAPTDCRYIIYIFIILCYSCHIFFNNLLMHSKHCCLQCLIEFQCTGCYSAHLTNQNTLLYLSVANLLLQREQFVQYCSLVRFSLFSFTHTTQFNRMLYSTHSMSRFFLSGLKSLIDILVQDS